MIYRILFLRFHPSVAGSGSQPPDMLKNPAIVRNLGLYPPLGLAHIASVCKQNGHEVKILDAYALKLPLDEIEGIFSEFSPHILCVSLWTATFESELEGVRILKSIKDDLIVIVGGPHMDLYARETMERYRFIDYGVIGEGEQTMQELLSALSQGRSLEHINGVIFFKNDKMITTSRRALLSRLDDIPFPLFDGLPLKQYRTTKSRRMENSIYILTARGCPFKCKYCIDQQFGRTVRFHSAHYVVSLIKHLTLNLHIGEINFYDDTFTLDKQRTLEICEGIINQKLTHIPWTVRTRPDTVDNEILNALSKAGCRRIIYGVESGNQRILDQMGREMTLAQIERAFQLTRKYGFEIGANFMIGYLGETRETFKQTIAFARALDPDYVMFTITAVRPNSDLYMDMNAKGIPVKDLWPEYVRGNAATVNCNFTHIESEYYGREDLDGMQANAYIKFYFRPKKIAQYLKEIRAPKQFYLYVKIAFEIIKNRLSTLFR